MSLLALRKETYSEQTDLGVQNVCGCPESNVCDFMLIQEFFPKPLNSYQM